MQGNGGHARDIVGRMGGQQCGIAGVRNPWIGGARWEPVVGLCTVPVSGQPTLPLLSRFQMFPASAPLQLVRGFVSDGFETSHRLQLFSCLSDYLYFYAARKRVLWHIEAPVPPGGLHVPERLGSLLCSITSGRGASQDGELC